MNRASWATTKRHAQGCKLRLNGDSQTSRHKSRCRSTDGHLQNASDSCWHRNISKIKPFSGDGCRCVRARKAHGSDWSGRKLQGGDASRRSKVHRRGHLRAIENLQVGEHGNDGDRAHDINDTAGRVGARRVSRELADNVRKIITRRQSDGSRSRSRRWELHFLFCVFFRSNKRTPPKSFFFFFF